jgi:hypothetical protein
MGKHQKYLNEHSGSDSDELEQGDIDFDFLRKKVETSRVGRMGY